MNNEFWTWLTVIGDSIDEADFGLVAEARRLADEAGGGGVTVIAVCHGDKTLLHRLGDYGADRVILLSSSHLDAYHGDVYAEAIMGWMETDIPAALLLTHNAQTADLAGRLGAHLASAVITRAVDAHVSDAGGIRAERPVANGYLFETIDAMGEGPVILTFLPAVLADVQPMREKSVDIVEATLDLHPGTAGFQTVETIDADPQTLDIEDADIVVAGGRGVGKDGAFDIIHRLARVLGGSVAGTRPVIDWQTLPFKRQVGQTGKSVSPRLIINCGISGANEYTAGIEKSKTVVAINTDPRARIFRFADLGIVGDLHAVLPLLVQRLEEMAEGEGR
ncbi:EtfA1: electron transfer flavoprotein, subunit alpha [Desulfosarcina variabilis str. Montpellier]|uniref:electron transfer flavoprotein subunit alpha/FixB family protein n=1 Tax=Desulfosarcina variabilis TaxID=2300 RepID=UPI003AFB2F29